MTTNPRGLEVAIAVLDGFTAEMRRNIVERGNQLVERFEGLQREFPDLITKVQGTGLLVSVELDPEQVKVVGFDGIEQWCRAHGLGVIHGGKNALRYTPHFGITSDEVDLVVELTRQGVRATAGLGAAAFEREKDLVRNQALRGDREAN